MTHTTSDLDVRWNHGVPRGSQATEPLIQVHRHDERTFILRQSKAVNYEAPFLYLLVGRERAFLLDTGATEDPALFPLRATIDGLIQDLPLVVAHSHGHHDHVAADAQFADRPHTTVVGRDLDQVKAHFGFTDAWPAERVSFDLGGRTLEILGSPGHHKAAITVFDPHTGFLLTGDTVLPGRLFAFDYPQFLATLDRLVAFAETRPVSHVLGCHVEMRSAPRRDYPLGASYQPDERALPMTVGQLRAARDAAQAVKDRPGMHRFADFVIVNEPRKRDIVRLTTRARLHKLLGR